jgi:hypothetical protein
MLSASALAGCDEITRKKILDDIAGMIPEIDLNTSPPETARIFYDVVIAHTGMHDLYADQKRHSNERALTLYPTLKKLIREARDPLCEAVELAIIGNIIDFGVDGTRSSKGIEQNLYTLLENRFGTKNPHFKYDAFRTALEKSSTLLYLGDNAGEIVFDKACIETILRIYPDKEIVFAVRSAPIINDALVEDARMVGLDKCVRVIESGSTCPGTVLPSDNAAFRDAYARADMVISKGQGNYESLSDTGKIIYYLFLAKCDVVARQAQVTRNTIMLRPA